MCAHELWSIPAALVSALIHTPSHDSGSVRSGKWLMFMDDDNYAKVHEIRTFVEVAHHTGTVA